jgi:hypothetical protein
MKSKKYNRKRVSESRRVSRQYRRKMSGGENIFWWELRNIHIGKAQEMLGRSSVYYAVKDRVHQYDVDTYPKKYFIKHYYNKGNLLDINNNHIEKEYDGEVYIERQYDTLYEDTVLYQIATKSPPDAFKDLHILAVKKVNKHKRKIGKRIDAEEDKKLSMKICMYWSLPHGIPVIIIPYSLQIFSYSS